jgi:hypothetical protein
VLLITLSALTLALLTIGATRGKGDNRNYEESWRYSHQAARKYRHQRDDLQRRLTRRVLEVRRLQARVHVLRRQKLHRPDVLEAIRLAAIAYGVDYGQMYNIADCETGGSFNRYSKNRHSSASGLFQFLAGTFAGTPYGRESIWSPYANALAAGWMMAHGRRGEWVC